MFAVSESIHRYGQAGNVEVARRRASWAATLGVGYPSIYALKRNRHTYQPLAIRPGNPASAGANRCSEDLLLWNSIE